ncbi:MFS transporter [Sphingomonas sp. IW22]|uniref:MFS transporter n=1 Tax=Sphingomonas sp. IW22 TaxID=3242489 RepID=UPI0035205E22
MPPTPPPAAHRSPRFLALYALASAGGVIAYLPLLSLLLPLRIETVMGDSRIGYAAIVAIVGAAVASGANILFGWASDRSVARGRGRRGWVAFGIVALALAYPLVAVADTPVAILIAVIGVQLAANALLAPLLAIMADEIPDAQKGVASGLLALGSPLGSAFSAVLIAAPGLGDVSRIAIIPLGVALCVGPFLLTRSVRATGEEAAAADRPLSRRDLAIAWVARLLVQLSGSVLTLYLLYYFQSLATDAARGGVAKQVGALMTLAYVLSLPAAVAIGRLSDRTGRRKAVLFGAAMVAAAGLGTMAIASGTIVGAVGYTLYAVGSAVFLVLHSGFAMLLLPSPRRRGRDLGIINLTNTAPSLIGPALAWSLATPDDFTRALLALAVLTLAGGGAILAVRGRD